jgi:hypothetical protein
VGVEKRGISYVSYLANLEYDREYNRGSDPTARSGVYFIYASER